MDAPKISATTDGVEVEICSSGSSAQTLSVEFVLDLNQSGTVIGIEVLNLQLEAGGSFLNRIRERIGTMDGSMKYSYDGEVDAFYLQLYDEVSADQVAVDGIIILNEKGEIVSLRANRAV